MQSVTPTRHEFPAAHPVRRMLRLAAMQRAGLINTVQCAERIARLARYEQEIESSKAQVNIAKAA